MHKCCSQYFWARFLARPDCLLFFFLGGGGSRASDRNWKFQKICNFSTANQVISWKCLCSERQTKLFACVNAHEQRPMAVSAWSIRMLKVGRNSCSLLCSLMCTLLCRLLCSLLPSAHGQIDTKLAWRFFHPGMQPLNNKCIQLEKTIPRLVFWFQYKRSSAQ